MKNNSSMYSIPNKFINKIIIQLKNKATKSKKILDHGEYKHDNQFIRNQLKNKKNPSSSFLFQNTTKKETHTKFLLNNHIHIHRE